MLVLLCLVFILTLPFKSKSRLEAENVALRHQVMVLRRQVGGRSHELRSAIPRPALPLVSVDPAGARYRSAGDRCSLASGRLSLLLALEITFSGRAAAD
jgi:hypothetical protein